MTTTVLALLALVLGILGLHDTWRPDQPWPRRIAPRGWATIVALVAIAAFTVYQHREQEIESDAASNLDRPFRLPRLSAGGAINLGGFMVVDNQWAPGSSMEIGPGFVLRAGRAGELLLNGTILDATGGEVAWLKDSKLRAHGGLGYDLNADGRALEVVDPEGRPVVQVEVREAPPPVGSEALIQLVTFDRDEHGNVYVYACAFVQMGCGPVPAAKVDEFWKKVVPIFEYPSVRNRGRRRNLR